MALDHEDNPRVADAPPIAGRNPDPLLANGQHERARARVAKLSDLLDTRFRLPIVGYRFGLDSVIGLIPGVGDLTTATMSLYLIAEAARAGARKRMIARMLYNVGVDTILGAVPVVGDLFDFAFKANLRNANLLRDHLDRRIAEGEKKSSEAERI